MSRGKCLIHAISAAVALAGVLVPADSAKAFGWRHWHGSSGGSWGSWGSSGGYWGGSSGGSWGSSGGLFHRWRVRHVYSHGSWGSHGGWVYYGSSGGSSGGWGSSGGSSGGWSYGSSGGSSGGWGTEYHPAAPATPATPSPAEGSGETGSPGGTEATGVSFTNVPNAALIEVDVPEDATVTVNGYATKSTGGSRSFISRGLDTGYRYRYEVVATVTRDGRPITESRSVKLESGQRVRLKFRLDDSPRENKVAENKESQNPTTRLVVHAPEDARVILAGSDTASQGAVRTFETSALGSAESWQNYQVRVEVDRDGQKLAQEEALNLTGGDHRELYFDFAEARAALVASAR